MRRLSILCLFVLSNAWADTVYFDNGSFLQNVRIVDAVQDTDGACVLVEPSPGVTRLLSGVSHIEFGNRPNAYPDGFRRKYPPMVPIVKRAVDGDTLELFTGERVRLIGVDTPETVDTRKPVEPFGKEASAFTDQLVRGKKVWMEFDRQLLDKYGRILGYIYLLPDTEKSKGFFLNEMIIALGFSPAYLEYPFRLEFRERFQRAEQYARNHRLRIWSGDNTGFQEAEGPTRRAPGPALSEDAPIGRPGRVSAVPEKEAGREWMSEVEAELAGLGPKVIPGGYTPGNRYGPQPYRGPRFGPSTRNMMIREIAPEMNERLLTPTEKAPQEKKGETSRADQRFTEVMSNAVERKPGEAWPLVEEIAGRWTGLTEDQKMAELDRFEAAIGLASALHAAKNATAAVVSLDRNSSEPLARLTLWGLLILF